jgi:hypothetical protein
LIDILLVILVVIGGHCIGGHCIGGYFIGGYFISGYHKLFYCKPLLVILLVAIDGY